MATRKYNCALSAERLRAVLHYNRKTGVFRWKLFRKGRCAVGSIAGCEDARYRKITIDGVSYLAHRLAWLYVYGEWPPDELDHKDRKGVKNSICNLRPASHYKNCCNRRRPCHSTSGYKGVNFRPRQRKWISRITVRGKRLFLGLHDTAEEAYEAYCRKAIDLHGEFANLGEITDAAHSDGRKRPEHRSACIRRGRSK
jgi:hypothetical protein